MSRATRPKGVYAFACLRFRTPGSSADVALAGSIAGWALDAGETGMIDTGNLDEAFRTSVNAELSALGCRLRVAPDIAPAGDTILLLDAQGNDLGWLPDSVDADAIAAFERILDRQRAPKVENSGHAQRQGGRRSQASSHSTI